MPNNFYYRLYRDENEFNSKLPRFRSEEEFLRGEFKFIKNRINEERYQIANFSILPEYQELFTKIMNEPEINEEQNANIEIDEWANLLNDIVDHPINN